MPSAGDPDRMHSAGEAVTVRTGDADTVRAGDADTVGNCSSARNGTTVRDAGEGLQ